MSWIWPSYVDRELSLTPAERKAIHREAWRLWFRNRWNVLVYLLVPAGYVLALPVARDLAGWVGVLIGAGGITYTLIRVAAMVLVFLAFFVLGGAVLQRYRFAPCVFRATRDHGHDVCVKCGYWLAHLGKETPRCPECGAWRSPGPEAGRDDGSS